MDTTTFPKEEKKKVRGITTGSFDILTLAHVKYLEWCKSQCDELLVLLDTDERIAERKGRNRPIQTLSDRAQIVQAISWVTWVSSFSNDAELIGQLQFLAPDIYFLGEEYKDKTDKIVGYSYLKDKIMYFPQMKGISTTNIERKIIENHFNS